jgi:hypothetical protein
VKIQVASSVKQYRLVITDVSNIIMILCSVSINDLLGASDHEYECSRFFRHVGN